ncbi:MAG: DNA polymerase III subunit gamma/tau [Alphaproteobacteria bacterium]
MSKRDHAAPYRVLARKYRPGSFSGLIGQDAMVRTLKNAIASGRLAHAFILTGVRGVGKTTTARIIARALNCVGPDGSGGPAPEPCGACEHCQAIAEDRHVDVIEMDAASRTGVDDIRELIEGVRYRPVSARYKIYIIDEVHMLSKSAFNALLKTLEEPPEHVKFIFATTEVRRVPVTVLSRCQRFDLRRVDLSRLTAHLAEVSDNEGIAVEPGALALLARAADGSVRDALSLLDTAIAHGAPQADGGKSAAAAAVTEAQVQEMLGLADRSRVVDLFDHVMKGEAAGALDALDEFYAAGADPAMVLQDLLEFCHWLTRLKVVPGLADSPEAGEVERERGREMAERLTIPALARAWQVLLKGLSEVHSGSSPIAAARMVLVRLAFAAELPAPAELVRRLEERTPSATAAGRGDAAATVGARGSEADAGAEAPETGPGRVAPGPQPGEPSAGPSGQPAGTPPGHAGPPTALAASPALAVEPVPQQAEPAAGEAPEPQSFADVVALFARHREAILHAHLMADVHLVRFEPGRIEFRPGRHAPATLANRLGELLHRWTGRRWVVSVSKEEGAPTLKEQALAAKAKARQEAAAHPSVRAVLGAFPGATIASVREGRTAESPTPEPTDGDEAP